MPVEKPKFQIYCTTCDSIFKPTKETVDFGTGEYGDDLWCYIRCPICKIGQYIKY